MVCVCVCGSLERSSGWGGGYGERVLWGRGVEGQQTKGGVGVCHKCWRNNVDVP